MSASYIAYYGKADIKHDKLVPHAGMPADVLGADAGPQQDASGRAPYDIFVNGKTGTQPFFHTHSRDAAHCFSAANLTSPGRTSSSGG